MMNGRKLLKWAGSKANVSSQIVDKLKFDIPYIEPFCGSAAFFFENLPDKAHLNDLNINLIECYNDVKSNPKEVWAIYNEVEITEERYYEVRNIYNSIDSSILKSGYFIYLNHYCFNGIYRTNKKGKFNTPFGAKIKVKSKLSEGDFVAISKALKSATFTSDDFETFLNHLSPKNSCIYLDPPYFTSEARVFGEYGAKLFSKNDLIRLHDICEEISKDNIVVISYRDCEEFRDLFSNHPIKTINVTRNVGGFAGRRKQENELLAVLGDYIQ